MTRDACSPLLHACCCDIRVVPRLALKVEEEPGAFMADVTSSATVVGLTICVLIEDSCRP
jgi:hypothetical protein